MKPGPDKGLWKGMAVAVPISLFLWGLIFLGIAHAATWYVSPSGSDSNAGTLVAPFKTVDYAASRVNPGDTVIAAAGIYYENDQGAGQVGLYVRRGGTSAAPVLFQSATLGGAIIDGNNTVQIGVYISAPYVSVQGFRVRNFTYQGVMTYGANTTLKGNIVNGNGASTTIQLAMGHDGIFAAQNAVNCMIDGNIIYANGRLSLAPASTFGHNDHGVYLCGPNSTVQNNLISGNQAYGIQIAGYVPLPSCLVQNNTILSNQSGIMIWQAGAQGCTIQGNDFVANATYGIDFLGDGGGHIIQGNHFFNNVQGAINPAKAAQWTGTNLVAP
jgi:hypothetical protein